MRGLWAATPLKTPVQIIDSTGHARSARTHACRVRTLANTLATEPKRTQERRAIPAGNVFGGRKLAFPPPWRSVFPRNRLFRFAFAVHPCLRELSGECERGTQKCSHHGGPCNNIDEYKGLACGSILYIRGCVRYGGVFVTFGGPAGPWELPHGRGSVTFFLNRERKRPVVAISSRLSTPPKISAASQNSVRPDYRARLARWCTRPVSDPSGN